MRGERQPEPHRCMSLSPRTMEPLQPCRFGRLKSRFGGTLSSPDDSLV